MARKKKSLKVRLADPNSRTWRNKSDGLWSELVRVEHKCAICGSTNYVQAHHLIPREFLMYRHLTENGIALCVRCHKYNLDCSAHKNPFAFILWLKDNRQWQYDWVVQALKSPPPIMTYQAVYRLLTLQTPLGDGKWVVKHVAKKLKSQPVQPQDQPLASNQ